MPLFAASSAARPNGCSASRGDFGHGQRRRRARRPAGRGAARPAVARCRGAPIDLPAEPVPPARIVKERRATFARHARRRLRRRPATRTRWANLRPRRRLCRNRACRPRSKARFAPALPRPTASPRIARRTDPDPAAATRECRSGTMTAERLPSARRCRCPTPARPRGGAGGRLRCWRASSDGRALGVRARGRRHDPGRIHPAAALSRRRSTPELEAQDRRLSAPHPGRAWRLAAVPRRRFRHQRQRQGLFRAEDGRRPGRRAAHGAGPRGDPGAWRRRRAQCLHPHPAGAVRRGALARGAGDAGRDHAAAALVPVSSRQGVVLVAHRDGAAAGADGAAAAGAQPARRLASPSCSSSRPTRVRDWITPPTRIAWSARSSCWIDRVLRVVEPPFPASARQRAIDKAVAFVDRAAQRRGRARRDLSRRWPTR